MKLPNQKVLINECSNDFETHFLKNVSASVEEFICELQKLCHLFLFSGIVRDYFLENGAKFRDIDLVYLANQNMFDVDDFLKKGNYTFRLNSFGGYKISIDGFDIDLWNIQNTWGIRKFDAKPFQELIYELIPKTAFFNFSSIIYFFSNKEFIYTEDFNSFLKTKKIDIVLRDNPNPALCIINIFYYKEKLKLELADKTIDYFLDNFENYDSFHFFRVQEKHFGKTIVSYGTLSKYFSKYWEKKYLKIVKVSS